MPKKKQTETPDEQSARFRAEVEKMIEAGELSPTDAAKRLDQIVSGSASLRSPNGAG